MTPVRVTRVSTPVNLPLRESSGLRSERDSGDLRKIWIKVEAQRAQIESLTLTIRYMQEQMNRLRLHHGGDAGGGAVSDCPYG